jgi:dihydrofolate synthase/folylpolyglutamate synthase
MIKPFSDLAQAEAWVFDLQKYGIKFGLSSTIRLVSRLGLPYQQGRYLHLAGTNGKGSVAAMLSAVLTRAGYPVGLFTSPHLVRFQERYRLNDQDISADRLLELINRVRAVIDTSEPPTFFEFATAMAFLFFFQEKAEPIIFETGMGGRLDATNIVQPLVSVITNISMDHMEYLGDTLTAVAGEKAGIIKPGAPLVTGADQKRVLHLFKQRCRELDSPMYVSGVDFHSRGGPLGQFSYEGLAWKLNHLSTNLPGRHQYRNAAVALAALEVLEGRGFTMPEAAIRAGLQQARWPGRLEQAAQDPRIILDGAHNPAAARVLAENLKRLRKNGRLIMVLGIMADKDFPTIIGRLLPLAGMAIFTRPRYFRAAKPEVLAQKAQAYGVETLIEPKVADAVRLAQSLAGPHDRIVVTGSLYTVGEAKEYLEG